MARDGLVIKPARQYSTIEEINEANANRIPIDYARKDRFASVEFDEPFTGEKAPEVYVDFNAVGLQVTALAEATEDARGLVDMSTATWSWGDATPNTVGEMRATHTYAAAGTYDVAFSVTDADGDVVTVTDTLTVVE
jgi:hypothetical protein